MPLPWEARKVPSDDTGGSWWQSLDWAPVPPPCCPFHKGRQDCHSNDDTVAQRTFRADKWPCAPACPAYLLLPMVTEPCPLPAQTASCMHPLQSQQGWAGEPGWPEYPIPWDAGTYARWACELARAREFCKTDASAERKKVSLFEKQLLKATWGSLDLCLQMESLTENKDQLEKSRTRRLCSDECMAPTSRWAENKGSLSTLSNYVSQ